MSPGSHLELRRPLLGVAVVFLVLVVLVELGSSFLVGGGDARGALGRETRALEEREDLDLELSEVGDVSEPPGRGISYLAFVDGVLLYSVGLIALSLMVPERVHGRAQGVVTLVASILLVIAAVLAVVVAFLELVVMVSLFVSVPFGTIAYLALWGFFPRTEAAVVLSLLLALKLGATVFLVLAHHRFLQNKGLVGIVVTSLVLNVVLAFLHGLVPGVLVSIADVVGAIVVAVVAAVWGIVLLVGSIPATVKALRSTASVTTQ